MKFSDDITPEPTPLPSGHVVGVDTSGKLQIQSTLITSELAEQFECAVERLGDLQGLPIGPALILSLPIRNAVVTPGSLTAAAAAIQNVYRSGEHLALEWRLSHGWRDRRFLEPLTCSLLNSIDRPHAITTRDWRAARDLLQHAMGEAHPRHVWRQFCASASAWWSDPMPHLLWSHCAGVRPMQPLSREAWARFHTKLPLLPSAALAPPEITPARMAYFAAGGQSAQSDSVARAVSIVKSSAVKHKSRQAFAEDAVKQLTDLLGEAQRAGRLQVLLVGFVIDLVINGGVRGVLAIGSLIGYLGQTLIRLFKALVDMELNAMGGDAWRAVYVSVLDDKIVQETQQRNKIGATLTAFHDYLSWLGVPPLLAGLGKGGPLRPPRAEVNWRHEVARSVTWLESRAATGDRLAQQASLVLLLIDEFMVRIEEVLGLRLGDFQVTGTGLTLFVYPRIRDGRIKADAVRRPVDLKSAELIRRLRAWIVQRRTLEGSDDEDFLFGAPRDKRSRFQHGKTYALVELALKVGSGEAEASSHGSRHRGGSEEGALACMPAAQLVDINPIDQISAGSGQGITHSLRSTYLNLFEEPMHAIALAAWGDNASGDAAALPPWAPPVEHGIALDRDEAWKSVTYETPATAPIGFDAVLAVLTDLSQEFGVESIRSRCGMSADEVKTIARVASSALSRILPKAERRFVGEGDFTAHQMTLLDLEPLVASSSQEKYLPVMEWLQSALSSGTSKRILTAATVEWKAAVRRFHLSLDEIHDMGGVIALLRAAKVPNHRLLITHRCPLAQLRPEVRQLGWHLRFEEKVRRGEPRVRLHVCSADSNGPGAIDSAISVKGLLGLFAAAEAWLAIRMA